jgi:hypothetical protein
MVIRINRFRSFVIPDAPKVQNPEALFYHFQIPGSPEPVIRRRMAPTRWRAPERRLRWNPDPLDFPV